MAQTCLCAFESWDLVSEHGFLGFRKVGIFYVVNLHYTSQLIFTDYVWNNYG